MTCKQSHTPRFQELAKCAKTSGIVSMMITSTFQITIQALRITLHTRIWHWKSGTDSICQNNTLMIATMWLRLSTGREESMFQSMWGSISKRWWNLCTAKRRKGRTFSYATSYSISNVRVACWRWHSWGKPRGSSIQPRHKSRQHNQLGWLLTIFWTK